MNPRDEMKVCRGRRDNYPTEQAYRDFLDQPIETVADAEVVQHYLDRFAPGVKVAAPSSPEYRARDQIRARAQAGWKDILIGAAFNPHQDQINEYARTARKDVPRALMGLIADNPGPYAENDAVVHAITSGNRDELTEVVGRRVRWAQQVARDTARMSDAQMVEHMGEVYNASKVLMEMQAYRELMDKGELNDSISDLIRPTEGQDVEMGKHLQGRLYQMGHDLYPMIDPADYPRIQVNSDTEAAIGGDNRIAPHLDIDETFMEYYFGINFMQDGMNAAREDYLKRELSRQYDQPDKVKLFDPRTGDSLGSMSNPNLKGQRPVDPIGITLPNGQKKLLGLMGGQPGESIRTMEMPLTALYNMDAASQLDGLAEKLDGAVLSFGRGSQEYKDMHQALKDVKAGFSPLSDPPVTMAEQKERLLHLKETTDAYLERKKTIYTGSKAEEKRRRAAENVSKFVESQLEQLRAIDEGGYANDRDRIRHPLSMVDQEHREMLEQYQQHYLDQAKTLDPGSPAQMMCLKVAADVNSSQIAPIFYSVGIPAQLERFGNNLVSQMCAMDLILHERTAGQDGRPGPVERTLNAARNPDRFVEGIQNTDAYRQIMPAGDATNVGDFLLEHKGRAFVQHAVAQAAAQRQAAQQQPAIQRQAAPQQRQAPQQRH